MEQWWHSCTVRLITHEAEIVLRVCFSRWLEKEIEEIIEDDQFGFKRGRGIRDAAGMSEWTLDIDEEVCVLIS